MQKNKDFLIKPLVNSLNEVYENNIKQISTIKNVNKFSTVFDLVDLIKELVKTGVDAFYFEIGTFETEFLNESFALKNSGLFDSYIDNLITYINALKIKNIWDIISLFASFVKGFSKIFSKKFLCRFLPIFRRKSRI